MAQKLELKDAARQLCDELTRLGQKLAYLNALDIVARLEGYADWKNYVSRTGGAQGLYNISIIYMTGFAEKGYWWTKAAADPWLMGHQGVDFDGPFPTEEQAQIDAQDVHPQAVIIPFTPLQTQAGASANWEQVSVFAKMRISVPMSPVVSKIAQQPGCEERRTMNDNFVFEPKYAQANGRVVGVSWRSPLKFNGVDTISRKAHFDFDARIEFSKPAGFDPKMLLSAMTFECHFADNWEEPEIKLLSWQ